MAKPNIEAVFEAFNDFKHDQHNARVKGGYSSLAFDVAVNKFKDRMKELGLYDYIDWTDRSGN